MVLIFVTITKNERNKRLMIFFNHVVHVVISRRYRKYVMICYGLIEWYKKLQGEEDILCLSDILSEWSVAVNAALSNNSPTEW